MCSSVPICYRSPWLLLWLQKDFHYEYTECDSEGGRWRVSVPSPNICTGGAPNAPVRGKGCGKCTVFHKLRKCAWMLGTHFRISRGIHFLSFILVILILNVNVQKISFSVFTNNVLNVVCKLSLTFMNMLSIINHVFTHVNK